MAQDFITIPVTRREYLDNAESKRKLRRDERKELTELKANDFPKICRIGTAKTDDGRDYSVFVKIRFDNGKLSISGVEGPLESGNFLGSCGQINMHEWHIIRYAPGWDRNKVAEFRKLWGLWNLNHMRSACAHQRKRGETFETHPSAICPDCHYSLGSAWLKEEVPQDVINFFAKLPETDRNPAWI